MAQWIWKFGEFEAYHNLLVHSRRQQYGYNEPAVWKLYPCEAMVFFRTTFTTEGGTFHVRANGNYSIITWLLSDGEQGPSRVQWGAPESVTITQPGEYGVEIRVFNSATFPCLYVDGIIQSDETWLADDHTQRWQPAGSYAAFTDPTITPETFPFSYQPISAVTLDKVSSGVLYDFGKETFARVRFANLPDGKVRVRFGESREEAMDDTWAVIQFNDETENGVLSYPPQAFRYIFVGAPDAEISAEYEYLPLRYRGSFKSNDKLLDSVWNMAAYTFHLNSREFFLDGIKRDRWVWAGDVWQSVFVNHYLFLDQDIERRTLTALAGKPPFRQHINTIVDYTFYWVMSLYEYYLTFGDMHLLRQLFPQLQEIMQYCLDRTDADGFMRGKEGDWIFIDWAPIDKEGALCGEQVLYARAMECYSSICALTGNDDGGAAKRAKKLQREIIKRFWDEDKGAFVDSYESGKRNITRQCNILAYLYLPCSAKIRSGIYKNVILNDDVRQITTPYFKFYEYQVHGMEGNIALLEENIRNYYGAMIKTGATTLYEEFDPTLSGVQHYAMYGRPFEKSLCHAWSASPIYLLGRFRMGVVNTGVRYDSFDVRPVLDGLSAFSGTIPLPDGEVRVSKQDGTLTVCATCPGGTLVLGDERIELAPNRAVTRSC